MKKIVIPSKDNISLVAPLCDGFLLGIKNLSVNLPCSFTIEEVIEMMNQYPEKEFFISVNKNMHQEDLPLLKEVLLKLEEMPIKGIFYYDVSVVEYKQEYALKHDLVWNQEHLTTNYGTCNYWYSFGATYSCLSSEITLEEIKTMVKHAKSKLMVPVFGYIPMFTSKRHVVENYLTHFHLSSKDSVHYIKKEGYTYPIVDGKEGTTVYSSHILNAIEEMNILDEMGIAYGIFNTFLIPNDTMVQVLKIYQEVSKQNQAQSYEKIQKLLPNCDKGFLYKETVYKVK